MTNTDDNWKALPQGKCYLRNLDERAFGESAYHVYEISQIASFPAEKLGALQYTQDGLRWFTAQRLNPGIKYDVFFSCSGVDYDKAERLQKALASQGVRSFVARQGIHYADNFERFLRQTIDSSLVLVVLLSKQVYDKPENVLKEIAHAEATKKKIVPCVIDNNPIDPDFVYNFGKRHRVESNEQPWEDLIEEVLRSIFKALGDATPAGQTRGQTQRLWDKAQKALVKVSRNVTKFLVVYVLFTCVILGAVGWILRDDITTVWNKLLPAPMPGVAVSTIVITPGESTVAFWTDPRTGKISRDVQRTATDDAARQLLGRSPDRLIVPFSKTADFHDSPATASLLAPSLPVSPKSLQWFLQTNRRDPPDLRDQASVLTKVGSALESAFSKVGDPKHATSWVIVHVDRDRCLAVWFRNSSSGDNFVRWPKRTALVETDGPLLAVAAKQQDEKEAGILSNDTVVFCGEVPALAIRSAIRQILTTSQTSPTRGDGIGSLPWLVDFQSQAEVEMAFATPITPAEINNDGCALLPDLREDKDLEEVEVVRRRLSDIVRALEIDQRKRRVFVAPFVF